MKKLLCFNFALLFSMSVFAAEDRPWKTFRNDGPFVNSEIINDVEYNVVYEKLSDSQQAKFLVDLPHGEKGLRLNNIIENFRSPCPDPFVRLVVEYIQASCRKLHSPQEILAEYLEHPSGPALEDRIVQSSGISREKLRKIFLIESIQLEVNAPTLEDCKNPLDPTGLNMKNVTLRGTLARLYEIADDPAVLVILLCHKLVEYEAQDIGFKKSVVNMMTNPDGYRRNKSSMKQTKSDFQILKQKIIDTWGLTQAQVDAIPAISPAPK